MMNRSILQKRYALFALITLMLVIALISASCSKQEEAVPDEADEVQTEEAEKTEEQKVEEQKEEEQTDESSSGFAPADKSDEDIMLGDVKTGDIFEEIRKVRRGEEDVNWDYTSVDLSEYCYVRGEGGNVCYTFKDLNGDGVDELLIGDENGEVLCVYMVKNGSMHVPDLSYYKMPGAVKADGVINTMQGNGIPDEDHKDGYFFMIDPSAPDGITETAPGTNEAMQFDWKSFE